MVLVDANVLAYLVLESEFNKSAQRLFQVDPDWHSEAFVFIELTNVLVKSARAKVLTMPVCVETLEEAAYALNENLHSVPHVEALITAHEFGISAYDARYIALARRLDIKLVTEDKRLRNAVPSLTHSLADALRDRGS